MGKMIKKNTLVLWIALFSFLALSWAPEIQKEARAGEGAAFVGGMVAGHVVGGFVRRDKMRTAAAVHDSYGTPRRETVYVQGSTTSSGTGNSSTEARLKQLDKLAAGGYITPEEYKAKKKEIINDL